MPHKQRRSKGTDNATRIIIGIIIGLVVLGIWQIFFVPHQSSSLWMLPGLPNTQDTQFPSVASFGVTLEHANPQGSLTEKQALIMANQLEPDAAAHAQSIHARYVLFTYPAHPNNGSQTFNKVPAWFIWYQKIVNPSVNAGNDNPGHDLYIFLDATSGNELLSIWP